jgi:ubiquinone/menaquinone biosynthesis C-methylase UbiE
VRESKKAFQGKRVRIQKGSAEKIPLLDASVDYAIMVGVYSNLGKSKHKALTEVRRVLKKDGILILSAYHEHAFSERMKYYRKVQVPIQKIVGTTVYFPSGIGDRISEQFSKSELKIQFAKAKLSLVHIHKKGIGYVCVLKK